MPTLEPKAGRRPAHVLGGRRGLARRRGRRARARPRPRRARAPAHALALQGYFAAPRRPPRRAGAGGRGRPARGRGRLARAELAALKSHLNFSRGPTRPRSPRPSSRSSWPTAPATCCCACSPAGWVRGVRQHGRRELARAPGGAARAHDRGGRAVGGGDVAQRPRPPADGAGRHRRGRGRARARRRRRGLPRAAQPLRARGHPLHPRRGAAAAPSAPMRPSPTPRRRSRC